MTVPQENIQNRYLEFSCDKVEYYVNAGENVEGCFEIHTSDRQVKGVIYSTDTRLKVQTNQFAGENCVVYFTFQGTYLEIGSKVEGNFIVLSNAGEYTIPFAFIVNEPIIESSMGEIRDLFQFTNLAKQNWTEAVSCFYDPRFVYIFETKEKDLLPLYLGLSRFKGNENNVEEFICHIHKKTPITYETDIDGFAYEDMYDSVNAKIVIKRSGWGYTHFDIETEGDFIITLVDEIYQDDFEEDYYELPVKFDAAKLHVGNNSGCIRIKGSCQQIDIPVSIIMHSQEKEETEQRFFAKMLLMLTDSYVDMKLGKISRELWIAKSKDGIDKLIEADEDNLLAQLFSVQVMLEQERFNEAQWKLDQIGNRLRREEIDFTLKCYYYFLTTLYNRDETYLLSVKDMIGNAYHRNPSEWRIAMMYLYLEEEYTANPELSWRFLEEQYKLGCTSPLFFSEAVNVLKDHPSYLLKLDGFEQQVLWFAAKNEMLTKEIIEHAQYIMSRFQGYSVLLFRFFTFVYEKNHSIESLSAICRLLILGDKRENEYFKWYELGIEKNIRIPKLYEYYMYSIDLDKQIDIPKMVIMYFAFQSNLDYTRNAYLYRFILENEEKYPELAEQYAATIDRFIMDQMKAGHIDDNLAFLYQNVLAPQMLRDDTVYSFTPLLFMHRIRIQDERIQSVIVVHGKVKGESTYPVLDGVCMIPIYGTEYQIFLQDAYGNRFTKSIPYENEQMMNHEQLLPFVGSYMEGRLSFDIYQCEIERNYITISDANVTRYKKLVESEQVIDSFKQEIRTKLLHYYYENDRIGDLDSYLEEVEAFNMLEKERAEFIRFMISRGLFDKAYNWIKQYGMAEVGPKNVARLISKRIISQEYLEDEFLVNVAFYIFKNSRYNESILRYLILYYEGTVRDLRDIWKAASSLHIDTTQLMERILRQMLATGAVVIEKVDILLEYDKMQDADSGLIEQYFEKISKDYFTKDVVVMDEFFDSLYLRYRRTGNIGEMEKLSLLKYWSLNHDEKLKIPRETVIGFVEEFLKQDIYFAFYTTLADVVPQLHYLKNKTFIEYRTDGNKKVKLHYHFDIDAEHQEDKDAKMIFKVEQMQEMAEGIYVKAFHLFHGEVVQYYITEEDHEEEQVTKSDVIVGQTDALQSTDRFGKLNDIIVSLNMQDEVTAQLMLEEYLKQDYCTRELFRVI